jgi:acetyl esterase/lipase
MTMTILASLLVASAAATQVFAESKAPGETLLLWPDGAPGALGTTEADQPRLDVYPVAKARSAVVVVPGGGYQNLALDHEGAQIARWLNERGAAAFVLHYRIAPRYHYPAPIQDGQRAVRLVRANAAKFGIDPGKIGIWGFSAGGHLASSVATHFDAGQPAAADSVERAGDRPDFAILAYGVLSLDAEITHPGSRRNLLGPAPDPALVEEFSNERQVDRDTPPCFLFHTQADPAVPVENSLRFYAALRRVGVPAELHVFEQGGHGVGLAQSDPQLRRWPDLLQGWMQLHGWLELAD